MFRESNMQENLLLINNSRVKTNDTIVLKNPYTLEVIAHVSRASIAEAAQAVEAAHAAFAVCRKSACLSAGGTTQKDC